MLTPPKYPQAHPFKKVIMLMMIVLIIVVIAYGGIRLTNRSHADTPGTVAQQIAAIDTTQLTNIDATVMKPSGSNVTNWPDPTCPRCNAGLGEAAAVVAYVNHDPAMLERATSVLDDALARGPQPGLIQGATNEAGPGEGTMFFMAELGPSLNMLRPQLTAAQIARYTAAITDAADWFQADGDYTYYANGNVNIGMMGVAAIAYQQTGNPTYLNYYNTAFGFLISPTLPRWKGYGWVVTKQPTKADGSDGAGYFVETGAGGSGLDIDYTQLQVDQLARVWLINHDPKVLYYLNMEMNTLLTKTDTANWTLDSSGGSRHTQTIPPRIISFYSAAYQVLAANGRTDLQSHAASELTAIEHFLTDPGGYSPGYYYDIGMDSGILAMLTTNLVTPTHTPATSSDVTPPSQPQGLTVTANSTGSVVLHWTATSDNIGIVKYYVRRDSPTSGGIIATVTDSTSYVDTTATPGISYNYGLQAVDAAGNVSIRAAAVTVTTPSGTAHITGDINGDGRVNALDVSILIDHDNQNYIPAELSHDSTVGAADLAILLSKWTW